MDHLTNKEKAVFIDLLKDDWKERAPDERRSDRDHRKGPDLQYFKRGGKERRKEEERRQLEERRDGWVRVGLWRSESVFEE